ncbi:MAG: ABC-2 family transporter protein [Clostridia bacterium]|nr:ABC-2 family transporter protein [Clostridia bacterium]
MRYMLHAMRLNLRSAAQYRASFLMATASQLVMTLGDLIAVLVLMERFTGVGQWLPGEILFFFGMMQVCFALVDFLARGITSFPPLVASGRFDAMLLRPRRLLAQVAFSEMDPRRLGILLVGGAAMLMGSAQLRLAWTAADILLLTVAVAGSFLLITGLFLIEATVSFFSVRSIEMVNVVTYGGRTACQYPVDIYPAPLKTLFMYVAPFGLCMHLPVSFLLGKPLLDCPRWAAYLAPLTGAAFFLIMTLVWRVGVRHYRSTGS